MNLRDALLQGLANLPGSRIFHIHVLASSPRKHSNLYPFATPRPRTFLQDILVLLSEQPTGDAPRVFVSAIEATLYHIPSTSSAVLYVSKVDSTGQAKSPSPTQSLVRAFLTYYVDPSTRPIPVAHLWVHLFARAQPQYLFPNSAEYSGKRPLTDIQLCAWWKRQLSAVASDVGTRASETMSIRLFHLLPGLGELEASHALDRVSSASSASTTASTSATSVSVSVPWTYGHPYGQTDVPLPCGPIGGETVPHIGHVIPWFDDDPKARFLDEIAYTTDAGGVRSPERKRPRTHRAPQRAEEEAESGTEKREKERTGEQTSKALKKVSIEEFWERMSFRQECIAGAVTGFFVMVASSEAVLVGGSGLAGQVTSQMMKRVLTSLMTGHEFPSVERAVWSTRVLEEAIKGLCDGLRIVDGQRADDSQQHHPSTPETPPSRLMYESYVYGSVKMKNAEVPRQGSVDTGEKGGITVLTVRRKKRGHP